jgi:hypothetical protein
MDLGTFRQIIGDLRLGARDDKDFLSRGRGEAKKPSAPASLARLSPSMGV